MQAFLIRILFGALIAWPGCLLVLLGYPLSRRQVSPSALYGFRTKATCSDIRVWYDANEVAGRDLVRLGKVTVALALLSALIPWPNPALVAGPPVLALVIGLVLLLAINIRRANRLLRAYREQDR